LLKMIRKRVDNEGGFTLIELIVVLMILGILTSIVIPRFSNKIPEAQAVKTQADIRIIQTAVDLYFLDYGVYPTDIDQLVQKGFLKDNPKKVDGSSHYSINPANGTVN